MNDDELKRLWKNQATPGISFSVEDLHRSASKLQRRVAVRNAIEYIACAFVVLSFAQYIVQYPSLLLRAGSMLIILATAVVAWQLHKRASAKPLPADMGQRPCVDFLRRQLTRQRDALRSVWLWYVAPFVPGMIVFRWGVETELGPSAPFARGTVANLIIALVFLTVIIINHVAAWRLQRRLEVLQAGVEESA
jgi:hypothetical protein